MNMKPLAFLAMSGLIGATAFAQPPQSSSAATPPASASATPPADNKPAGPSPETLKKAKSAGYHAKVKSGQTVFCKTEAEIGSHFTEEKCVGETQMLMALDRAQQQREGLGNHTCSAGGACGGK
jgi:hypothetical protein